MGPVSMPAVASSRRGARRRPGRLRSRAAPERASRFRWRAMPGRERSSPWVWTLRRVAMPAGRGWTRCGPSGRP